MRANLSVSAAATAERDEGKEALNNSPQTDDSLLEDETMQENSYRISISVVQQ